MYRLGESQSGDEFYREILDSLVWNGVKDEEEVYLLLTERGLIGR